MCRFLLGQAQRILTMVELCLAPKMETNKFKYKKARHWSDGTTKDLMDTSNLGSHVDTAYFGSRDTRVHE